VASVPIEPARAASAKSQILPRLFRSKAAFISAIVLLLVAIAAIAAPQITPNDPFDISLLQRLKPPGYVNSAGDTFWLGTDTLGRDVYARRRPGL
jgi:peptide/nickel transport system permease protein